MGHAIQNSRALLTALQENDRELEMVHFCVGPYNTTKDEKGENCAILIGKLGSAILRSPQSCVSTGGVIFF